MNKISAILKTSFSAEASEVVKQKLTQKEQATRIKIPDKIKGEHVVTSETKEGSASIEVEYRRSFAYNSGSVKVRLFSPCEAGKELELAKKLLDQSEALAKQHIFQHTEPTLHKFAEGNG